MTKILHFFPRFERETEGERENGVLSTEVFSKSLLLEALWPSGLSVGFAREWSEFKYCFGH